MHSVILEPTKMILIGTRTTHRASSETAALLYQKYVPIVHMFQGCFRWVCTLLETRVRIGSLPITGDHS